MELQSLKLVLTDADLNAMARRFLPPNAPVTNVQLSIADGAVQVSGTYPKLMLSIPFSTTWQPSIDNGKFRLKLSASRVVGLPASLLHGIFLDAFRKAATKAVGMRVEEDGIVIDLDAILADRGIPLRTNLKSVSCEAGRMTIEA
jgi:hypothetical protein